MSRADSPVTRSDVFSRDPEYAHDVLRTSFVDFSVRISGSADDFEFRQARVSTPEFAHTNVRYSMNTDLVTGPQPGPLVIDTVRGGRLEFTTDRDSLQAGVGVPVLYPAAPATQCRMSDLDVDSIMLDRAVLDRAAASAFGLEPGELTFLSGLPASPAAATYWTRLAAHVEQAVLADDALTTQPLLLAEATRSLATAVLVTFPNTGLRLLGGGEHNDRPDPAVLRRALAYIDEHAGEDIGVDDIAAAARIGVRGLQSAFRRHRDRTPLAELRRVRMARAHADLQAGDPTRGDSVAAIAARWGFTSPGRFSVQYRQLYGCSPSNTLRS